MTVKGQSLGFARPPERRTWTYKQQTQGPPLPLAALSSRDGRPREALPIPGVHGSPEAGSEVSAGSTRMAVWESGHLREPFFVLLEICLGENNSVSRALCEFGVHGVFAIRCLKHGGQNCWDLPPCHHQPFGAVSAQARSSRWGAAEYGCSHHPNPISWSDSGLLPQGCTPCGWVTMVWTTTLLLCRGQ